MRLGKTLLSIGALALLLSCRTSCSHDSNESPPPIDATISDGSTLDAALHPDASTQTTPTGCPTADRFIYLIGAPPEDHRATALFRFDAERGETARVGAVACSPFSIAVDRRGVIWANGEDHRLYTIDATTGACHATAFAKNQHGFEQFYLAFVADPSSANGEILYASDEHYSHGDPTESRGLATIPDTLKLTLTGEFDHRGAFKNKPCAILGTGDGRLFAQCSGGELWSVRLTFEGSKVPLDPVATDLTWLPRLNARPLAFWGGSIWLFKHPCDVGDCEAGSHVTRFDLATGVVRELEVALPLIVSAATSSTCAPL